MADPVGVVVVDLDESCTDEEVREAVQHPYDELTALLLTPAAKARIARYYRDRGDEELARNVEYYEEHMNLGGSGGRGDDLGDDLGPQLPG